MIKNSNTWAITFMHRFNRPGKCIHGEPAEQTFQKEDQAHHDKRDANPDYEIKQGLFVYLKAQAHERAFIKKSAGKVNREGDRHDLYNFTKCQIWGTA